MTRKQMLSALLLSSVLLTACQDTEETSNEPDPDPIEELPSDDDPEQEPDDENGDDDQDNPDEVEDDENNGEKEYLYEVNSTTSSLVPIEGTDANENVALLTYDDAPEPGRYALEIAEILIEYDAPAIFFVNGMYLENEESKDVLREIYDMGFTIGNHTYTHADLQSLSEEQQFEEIMKTSDLVEEIIDERPRFFRAPFGQNTDYSRQLAHDDGMVVMNWTYGYDYFEPYMEADKLAEAMITGKAPEINEHHSLLNAGANLLMHDREWTMQATPAIIEGLREQGYELLDPELIQPVEVEETESEETD